MLRPEAPVTIVVLLPTGRCEAVKLREGDQIGEILRHLVRSGKTATVLRIARGGERLDPAASLESAQLGEGDIVSGVETNIPVEGEVDLTVVLPSGRSAQLKAQQAQDIQKVIHDAKRLLEEVSLKLFTEEGLALDPKLPLYIAGLNDHATLTAIVQTGGFAATSRAFAFWYDGGDVMTWVGGDIPRIQLRGVQHIEGNRRAFAAITVDGRVCTWGSEHHGGGGDAKGLLGVVRICPVADGAFAAVLADGHVFTWGQPSFGGNSVSVQEQLYEVKEVRATAQACAALRADGRTVTWGHHDAGGDSTHVQGQLHGVRAICGSSRAFAAIVQNGGVVTWGKQDVDFGADSGSVQDQLQDVEELYSSSRAFAAVRADRSVVTWGDAAYGGDSSQVQDQLQDVQSITSSARAFAALRADCTVVTWGEATWGGDSSRVSDELRDVRELCATTRAFAALRRDGSVVSWGDPAFGGAWAETGVRRLWGSENAFMAVLDTGEVCTCGQVRSCKRW